MCDIPNLPTILVWTFIASAVVLAVLSRRLNGHLLEIPTQPTGPFSLLFRRRYHVRVHFFLAPKKYFDKAGQPWVKRFIAVTLWTILMLLALVYALNECDLKSAG